MRRCFDHDATPFSHLVQRGHRVRQFGHFDVLEAHTSLLFALAHLLVVEEVLWQEADYLVAVLDPILHCNLYTAAREELVLPVAHRHVLGVKHDQWLLTVHGERLAGMVFSIDLGEKILCCDINIRGSLVLFLLLLDCWLSDFVALIGNVCPGALEPLE